MKPLLVMALESESQGKLEALGFEVLYCGVGKVNAAYQLTRRLLNSAQQRTFSHVINLGSAGSRRFATGSVVAADRFIQRDMDVAGLGFALGATPFDLDPHMITLPQRFKELEHGICESGDSFQQTPSMFRNEIIDMEAYALAKVCLRENMPFSCVKYITDGADTHAATDWQTNLDRAGEAFASLLKQHYASMIEVAV